MSTSNNTTGILQQQPQTTKNIRTKKAHGNRTVQKSLDSPMHAEQNNTKTSKAVESLRKANPATNPGSTHKKRFYNSMVVSGMLPKEANATPKVANQTSQH